MHRVLWLLLCTGCSSVGIEAGGSGGAAQAVPVTLQVVETSDLATTVEAAGVVLADAEVELRFEVSGRVVAVGFEDGDEVAEGATLVRLDDADARAAVKAATAKLALAQANLDRTLALHALDRVSDAERDAAGAQVKLSTTERTLAERALSRMVVRAPAAGRVTVRQVEVGTVVDPGTVITTLVDADPLIAAVAVPEEYVGRVVEGLPASVWRPARPDQRLAGTVRYVAPAVERGSRLLPVRVELGDDVAGLLPGQTVRVSMELGVAEGQLLVPSEALVTRAEGAMVWVVSDGVARERSVLLGARRAEDVAIVHGLEPGESIVVQGITRLRDGSAVRTGATAEVSR